MMCSQLIEKGCSPKEAYEQYLVRLQETNDE